MITQEEIDTWEEGHQEQMTPLEMVKEFSRVTQQTPKTTLYSNLIKEEFKEWREAAVCAPLNKEGACAELKELADLVYVVYGYANACGWDLDEALLRVHQNNLGRCVQPDGSVQRREDGKILKRKDYPKVDLNSLV